MLPYLVFSQDLGSPAERPANSIMFSRIFDLIFI